MRKKAAAEQYNGPSLRTLKLRLFLFFLHTGACCERLSVGARGEAKLRRRCYLSCLSGARPPVTSTAMASGLLDPTATALCYWTRSHQIKAHELRRGPIGTRPGELPDYCFHSVMPAYSSILPCADGVDCFTARKRSKLQHCLSRTGDRTLRDDSELTTTRATAVDDGST